MEISGCPSRVKMIQRASQFGLEARAYYPQELYFILQGNIRKNNTILKRTCNILYCIVHYVENTTKYKISTRNGKI